MPFSTYFIYIIVTEGVSTIVKSNVLANPHITVYCHNKSCGKPITKRQSDSWGVYSKRKYCSYLCNTKAKKDQGNGAYGTETEFQMGGYIAEKSRNGRLMADYYLGILKAVEKVKDSVDIVPGNKIICSYKGVPVTGDLATKAGDWLVTQWKGRPNQRVPDPETDDRTEGQKMDEAKYIFKELGYELVKIGEGVVREEAKVEA